MSHDLYNPYSPERPNSPLDSCQTQSAQVGHGNVVEPSHLVPGSSDGFYSRRSMNSSHNLPFMPPGSFVHGLSNPATELESAIECHIKQAREEVRLQSILKKPTQDQNAGITNRPEESLGFGPAGCRSTPISQGQFPRHTKTAPSVDFHWPESYQTGEASYSNYPSSSSSSLSAMNIPISRYSQSAEPYPVSCSSAGDNHVGNNLSTKAAPSTASARWSVDYERHSSSTIAENHQTRYTCESAMDILKRFNLQEEDLEELCTYPEDQLSPANLPYLLRDIRQKKEKKSSDSSQSCMNNQAQGSQRAPETMVGSRANGIRENDAPPTFQQPSQVIEYGHTSRYTVGFKEEDGDRGHQSRSVKPSAFSGSESGLMDGHIQETQPDDSEPGNHGVPVSSIGSMRSTIASPAYSLLPSQRPAAQSIQSAVASQVKEPVVFQSAATTSSIPKRDSSAARGMSSGSQRPAQGAGTNSHRTAQNRTNSQRQCTVTASSIPAPGDKTASHGPAPGSKATSRTQSIGTVIHKSAPYIETTSHKSDLGTGTTNQRPVPGTETTRPAPCVGTTSFKQFPGAVPECIPVNQTPAATSEMSIQGPTTTGKSMPTAAMVSDYMGVTPDLFPHSCGLCNKPCVDVKDWLDHRKHKVHLNGCRLLRKQYSEWEPDTVHVDLDSKESQEPPTTTTVPASSSQSSSLQAAKHGGPSLSNSASPLPSKQSETAASRPPQRKRLRSPERKSRSSSSSSPNSYRHHGKMSSSPARKSRRRSRSPQRGHQSRATRDLRSSRQTCRSRSTHRSPHPASQRRRSHSQDRRSSSHRHDETRVEHLAKKLRESSDTQASTGSSTIEVVVQSLLTELARLRASSSSFSTSSKDQNKPSSASSSGVGKKPSCSSSSRDEKKPSSASSSREEKKPSASTSCRDEKKPPPSSLSTDEQKQPSSSVSSNDQKQSTTSSSKDEHNQPSCSSSQDGQLQPAAPLTGGRTEPPSSLSSTAVKVIKKVPFKKSLPTKSEKPQVSGLLGFKPAHPPLCLSGLPSNVSQAQVLAAVEKFGKTRLISMAYQRQQATVYFLQANAAQTLLGITDLKIGGNPITVTQKEEPQNAVVLRKVPANKTKIPVQPVAPRPLLSIFPTTLFLKSIKCMDVRSWTLNDFHSYITSGATIMVTDLPEKGKNHYKWLEVMSVLEKFGNIERDKYFILPDNCTAFVATATNKMACLMTSLANGAHMGDTMVRCHLLEENALRSPIAFYQHLLKWSEKVYDETTLANRLVYISDFPTGNDYWMKALQELITKTGGVKLYLPLMGKVFVEFVTVDDADRFGAWLSSFRPKQKLPYPARIMRPGLVLDTEATTPVRAGSEPPFWMVVPALADFYPTLSPQFYIPAHRTVNGGQDVEWAKMNLIKQKTLMVTGLPMGGYSHMDLLVEVFPYFWNKDIICVFYNVVILPLERRAFIYFEDGGKCRKFVLDYLLKPFTIGGLHLTLHFLLEVRPRNYPEKYVFKRMLTWTNVVAVPPMPEVVTTGGSQYQQPSLLIVAEMTDCSAEVLKFIITSMSDVPYINCVVLANRVMFQIFPLPPRPSVNTYGELLCADLNSKLAGGTKGIPKQAYMPVYKFRRDVLGRNVGALFKGHSKAPGTPSRPFPHNPSAPGPSAPPTCALNPAAAADPSASAQDQARILYSSPDPPVLSQEMYHFFAKAINQHRQSRGIQEVSQEKEQVFEELPKPTCSSMSREVHSNSSITSHSSSLSGASVSSSGLPKSSSSPSVPPLVGLLPPSSEQNTKKAEESPARLFAADDTTQHLVPPGHKVTRITTRKEVQSLLARKATTVLKGDMAGLGHKMVAETSAVKNAESLTEKETLHIHPSQEEEGKSKTVKAQQALIPPRKDMLVSSEDTQESSAEADETPQRIGDGHTSDHMLHSGPRPKPDNQHLVQPETPGIPEHESKTPEAGVDDMLANVTDEAAPVQAVSEDPGTGLEEEMMTVVEEQTPSASEAIPTMVSDEADALLNSTSIEEYGTQEPMACVEGFPPKERFNMDHSNMDATKKEQVPVSGTSQMAAKEGQRTTTTSAQSTLEEQPLYQVVDSVGEEEDGRVAVVEPLSEEPLRGKRGRKVTGSDAKTEENATKRKNKTTEQTAPPQINEAGSEMKATDAGEKESHDATKEGKEQNEESTKERQKTKERSNKKEQSTTEEKSITEERSNKEVAGNKEVQSTKPSTEKKSNKEPTEKENNKELTKKKQTSKDQNKKAPTEEEENSKERTVEKVARETEQRQSKRVPPRLATKPMCTRRSTRRTTPTMEEENPTGHQVEKQKAGYQILDSVEEDASSPRGGASPPSGVPLPHVQPHPEEDCSELQVVDSVEDEVPGDNGFQLPITGPTTRGKRGRPPKRTAKSCQDKKGQPKAPVEEEADGKSNEPSENQDSPTRTEAKQQEAPELTPIIVDSVDGEPNQSEPTHTEETTRGKEDCADGTQPADKAPPRDAKPRASVGGISLEEVATYHVLDSVEEEEEELEVKAVPYVLRDARGRGRKRGRAQKTAKPLTRRDYKLSLEETMYEVLDSIEGDVVEAAPEPPGRPRHGLAKKDPTLGRDGKVKHNETPKGTHAKPDQDKKKGEEELARPVGDSEQPKSEGFVPAPEKRRSARWRKEQVPVSGTSQMAAKEGQRRVKDSQEEVYQVVDSTEDNTHKEEHVNSPGPRRRSSRRGDPAQAKTPTTAAQSTLEEKPLYQVVDTVVGGEVHVAVEEPLSEEPLRGNRGRKFTESDAKTEENATKKKKKTTEQTAPPQINEAGSEMKATNAGEKESHDEEKNFVVGLNEVGEAEEDYPNDSVPEEELKKKRRREEEEERNLAAEMEGLVTLDEIGEDEDEEVDRGGAEKRGRREGTITEGELQSLVTLDKIVEEGEEPTIPEYFPPLPDNQSETRLDPEIVCGEERASSLIAEEGVHFVTLDEVGYEEEEETQRRSKRVRPTTVRRSTTREQQAALKPSGQEALPTTLHATSRLANEPGVVLSDKVAEPMAEGPACDREETEVEERRVGRKACSKARTLKEGAEPKRVRTLSPPVSDYTLPPFTPHNPLGVDHVVPKTGFYCNLCSEFYEDETNANTLHCSSLGHYNNLKKYYQRLQEEHSRSQSGGSAAGTPST